MSILAEIVTASIERPDPDGQYRLRPCSCGSLDVAYNRLHAPRGMEWRAVCLTCGNTSRYWPIKHHAQIEWNGRERPSWERD